VTAEAAPLTRREAIRVLEEGRARIEEFLDRLPRSAMTTPGLGGGAWSPKDLIGHLASWEEHALDALAAWARDERAPIDDLWRTVSTTGLNDQAVRRKAAWSLPRVRRESERTHEELIEAIASMADERWGSPATSRGRKPLGSRLGAILVGKGPFGHDVSHLASLRAFVELHDADRGPPGLGAPTRRVRRPA
jgi:hypothetical protein